MSGAAMGWQRLFEPGGGVADGSLLFATAIRSLLPESTLVIDVGCGRGGALATTDGSDPHDYRGDGRRVIGIDPDPVGADHPAIDEFRLITDGSWPLADRSVDLAVSDWTLEHVTDPGEFVAELRRVLRPGGCFVARTVSRHSLVATGARAVPNSRHAGVVSRLQPGRGGGDVFPTAYRMNTRKDLARLLDPEFEWSVTHLGGTHHYFHPWPRAVQAVKLVEPRLPRSMRLSLVICARRRGNPDDRAAT